MECAHVLLGMRSAGGGKILLVTAASRCQRPLSRKDQERRHRRIRHVDWTAAHRLPNADHASRKSATASPATRPARRRNSRGEEFLECCDKVLSPLTGGVPLTLIAKFTQPISEKLGLKTGKTRSERLAEPPGNVIVALLCSLAAERPTNSAR